MKEIEARFLDIDMNKLRKDLKKIKAKKIHGLRLYRRCVFDLCEKYTKGYARVRDEDGKITVTVKTYPKNSKYANEYEVALKEGTTFEDARQLMIATGLKEKAYHETLREKWNTKEGVEVTIDIVPGLPPYTEIEAKGEDNMKKIVNILGYDLSKASYGAYGGVFDVYYGISQKIMDDDVRELKFNTIDKVLNKLVKKNKTLLKKIKKDNLIIFQKST